MCGALILILLMLLCFLYINHFQQLKERLYSVLNYFSGVVKINEPSNMSESENEKFKNIDKNIGQGKRSSGGGNGSGDNNANTAMNSNEYNTTDNSDLIYYENDTINQSNINENSYDVLNQIDKIDYSNVRTGIQKCEEKCNGTCFEMGYTGSATCYPKQTKTFDYGTLYKNPAFSYGTNAYNPDKKK